MAKEKLIILARKFRDSERFIVRPFAPCFLPTIRRMERITPRSNNFSRSDAREQAREPTGKEGKGEGVGNLSVIKK